MPGRRPDPREGRRPDRGVGGWLVAPLSLWRDAGLVICVSLNNRHSAPPPATHPLSFFFPTKKNTGASEPATVDAALFLKSWQPKLVTVDGPEVAVDCTAVDGGTPGLGSFGSCVNATGPAAQCGCTPGFSTCPDGTTVQSCSLAQYPATDGLGADWGVGTSLVQTDLNRCIGIWVNLVPVPRASSVRVKAVCSRIEK